MAVTLIIAAVLALLAPTNDACVFDSAGPVPLSKANALLSENAMCKYDFTPVQQAGMYKTNRDHTLSLLYPAESGAPPASDYVLVLGLESASRAYADTDIPFRQASPFAYLTGIWFPDAMVVVHPLSGRTTLFVRRLSQAQIIFDGGELPHAEIVRRFDVDAVKYADELHAFLVDVSPRPQVLHTFDRVLLERSETLRNLTEVFDVREPEFHMAVQRARMYKTPKELDMLRVACGVSSQAHSALMRQVRPGWTEMQAARLMHGVSMDCGLEFLSYPSIAGAGKNAAILHYVALRDTLDADENMLVDAAGEYFGYTCDITRSWPAATSFSRDQRLIYEIVLEAQVRSIAMCRHGADWGKINELSNRVLLQGLVSAGFVKGTVDFLYSENVHRTFQYHGLGHTVGLDVHDPWLPVNGKRMLEKNMVITVEPGLYFTDLLFDMERENATRSKWYNWDLIERFKDFGGVRIEDVLVITDDGVESLSFTPKTVAGIESLRKLSVVVDQ